MKRNMDLVRDILLALEEYEHGIFEGSLNIEGYTSEQVAYHVYLLGKAGLLVAMDTTDDQSLSPEAIPRNLTWQGHEFIENSRDPSIWEQSKLVINKAGGASLAIWSEVLKQTVLSNLGINS